jgi:hypothetical protein
VKVHRFSFRRKNRLGFIRRGAEGVIDVASDRHVWNPLGAIRSCDAKRFRECHRELFAGLQFQSGPANQVAFNAALAVIDGVRPKDEIEAILAARMAVTDIVLLELVARTRGSIAG